MAYNVFHLYIAQHDLVNLREYFPPKYDGFYYFGSIFPDSHVLFDPKYQKRFQFHLSQREPDIFLPVKRLFKSFSWDFNRSQHRAFYLGYASHLLADKIFGHLIYLPYFSNQTFSYPTLYFDIFRYYHNSLYPQVYKNKKIINCLKQLKTKPIENFFSHKHLNRWIQITLKQLQAMPFVSAHFNEFVGNKDRFQKAADNYSKLIPKILKVIDKKTINQTEKLTQKLLSITKPEIFNPKSIIKLEDIMKA